MTHTITVQLVVETPTPELEREAVGEMVREMATTRYGSIGPDSPCKLVVAGVRIEMDWKARIQTKGTP